MTMNSPIRKGQADGFKLNAVKYLEKLVILGWVYEVDKDVCSSVETEKRSGCLHQQIDRRIIFLPTLLKVKAVIVSSPLHLSIYLSVCPFSDMLMVA
jgi:hypothetical protein